MKRSLGNVALTSQTEECTGYGLRSHPHPPPSCGAGGFESFEALDAGIGMIVLGRFGGQGVVKPIGEILADRGFVLQVVENSGVDLL